MHKQFSQVRTFRSKLFLFGSKLDSYIIVLHTFWELLPHV